MVKTFAAVCAWSVVLAAPVVAQDITLFSPKTGSLVDNRHPVRGTVDFMPEDGKVWILVKPVGVSDIWVQPFSSVDAAGAFEGVPHFGRPGDIDTGKRFEFRLVADPLLKLEEGLRLSDWPKARARTGITRVTRR